MSVHAIDDAGLLNRYLLGLATEEEMAAIEDRVFEDEAFFASVEVAADDLAARYVKGALSPDDRARFRAQLAGSGDDRLRLRVSRALAAHAAESRSTATVATTRWNRKRAFSFLAAAATIAMVAGVGALSWRVTQLGSELSNLRTSMTEAETASQSALAAAAQRELAERGRREAIEQQVSAQTTVSFVVTPGTERGEQRNLVIQKSATFVRFELALDRSLPARCRVIVKDAERRTIWSQDVSVAPDAASIVITIPASLLGTSEYEVTVASIGANGSVTEEASYGLSVTRR